MYVLHSLGGHSLHSIFQLIYLMYLVLPHWIEGIITNSYIFWYASLLPMLLLMEMRKFVVGVALCRKNFIVDGLKCQPEISNWWTIITKTVWWCYWWLFLFISPAASVPDCLQLLFTYRLRYSWPPQNSISALFSPNM